VKICKALFEKTSLEYMCELIIEPLVYENNLALRIIDSKFKNDILNDI